MEVSSRFSGLKINYKVLIGMILSVGVFGYFVQTEYFCKDVVFLTSNVFSISLELGIVGISAYLVKRYNNSKIFGRSFLYLSIGFVSVAIGNILLLAGVKTHPDIDTIFFFGLYIFLFCYLYTNIKSFNHGFRLNDVLVMASVASSLVLLFYAITSWNALSLFLLHYCGLAVIGSATVASMSLFGFKVLKKQAVGRSWKVLSIGLVMLTLNDIWFHYWDTTTILPDNDPVNFARYASYMVIMYALYMHKKVF